MYAIDNCSPILTFSRPEGKLPRRSMSAMPRPRSDESSTTALTVGLLMVLTGVLIRTTDGRPSLAVCHPPLGNASPDNARLLT
jgi:hypothetical protein